MKPSILSGTILVAAALAVPPGPARQDVALKDLMPKGMVIGVAVNQRQFEGADATAVTGTERSSPAKSMGTMRPRQPRRRTSRSPGCPTEAVEWMEHVTDEQYGG